MVTVAPGVKAALRDANKAWPGRNHASDGTLGDAAHQKRKSDHNTGDAVDITNDPAHGADGNKIAAWAIRDPRVKYVIWNRRIYNTARPGWRPYHGANPHNHHVHISLKRAARADTSPWGWTSGKAAPSIDVPGQSTFGGAGPGKQAAAAPKGRRRKAVVHRKRRKGRRLASASDQTGGRHIYDGEHTVVLGSKQRMAAHVKSPHTGGGKIAKGSRSVFVGRRRLAFARLADPTTDGLNVKTAEQTIWMG